MFSRDTLAIMEAAVDAVVIIDHLGRVQAVNEAACRTFGYRTHEMLGQNVSMLMPEPDGSRHAGFLANYRKTGESHIIGIGRDVVARRSDGTLFPVRLSVGRVPETVPARFVGMLRDTTAEQKAHAALKSQRDRARAYLELHDSILLDLDPEVRIREISSSGAERLGGTVDSLVGQNWMDFMCDDRERERARLLLTTTQHDGVPQESEFDCVDVTGAPRRILWRCIALGAADGERTGWLCSGADVTARVKAEQQARLTKDRLIQISQLATAGEMAAGLAHEINQPLTAITSYARACERYLEAQQPDLGEIGSALREITAEGLRAGDIIKRLRRMVRLDAPDTRTAVDVNALIEELRSLLESDARAYGVGLRLELAPQLPAVIGNNLHLQQVVLNLARNGFEALRDTTAGQRLLTVRTTLVDGDELQIQVDDNGPGIDPAIVDRLFEPFCTTKPVGTGLGLSMSRSIVQSHGGTIAASALKPRGTRFVVRLPAFEEVAA